jgi:GAF domain-containing protein
MMTNDNENLRWQQLESENKIARAISKLFDLEDIVYKACNEIKSQFGFDFVGISLVSLSRNTIETVHGIGIAENWANQARHSIEEDSEIRDIQADIVKTCRTEVIAGNDKRFDEGIYDTFDHHEIIRIFTPILLIRDKDGVVEKNWFDRYDWKRNFTCRSENQSDNLCIDMIFPSDIISHKAIGTIEAGYKDKNSKITYEQALEFAKASAMLAPKIREARLRYVLELVAKNAKQTSQADSVTLHFLLNPEKDSYMYQARSYNMNFSDPEKFSPRLNQEGLGFGLGYQAIQEKTPIYINSSQRDQINPIAYDKGTRSCAIFPLILDHGKKNQQILFNSNENQLDQIDKASDRNVGVMYFHFREDHDFTDDEKDSYKLIADQAVNAIWQAMTYQKVRDKARHLTALHSISESISQTSLHKDVLKNIAWSILNALACDVVTIYSYIQTKEQFITPPSIAGRLKSKKDMEKVIIEGDIPFMILDRLRENNEKSIYISDVENDGLFKNSPFTDREHIKSLASVLLKIDGDVVGIMFINYRRKHIFSAEEQQMIRTLRSSAATAIKNQRWLQTLNEIEKEIITTLEPEIIDTIIERAVQITGADLGVILQLDPINQNFDQEAIYPKDSIGKIGISENIDDTTIRSVIRTEKSELVTNVDSSKNLTYFSDTVSQICVPLLGTNKNQDGFTGIINMESYHKTFTQRDLQKLEDLSYLAVIAIQNVKKNEKLGNMRLMSTLGQFTGQLLHQSNQNIGALSCYLVDLQETLKCLNNYDVEEEIINIKTVIGRMSTGLARLKHYDAESISSQNINQIIDDLTSPEGEIPIPPRIDFRKELSDPSFQVLAGKQQLVEIISNVLQNSIDSISDEGILIIQAKKMGAYIEIKIEDNGSGIAEDYIKNITKLGVTTKSDKGNMGFGLWWTNIQVENLGGKLNIFSKSKKGTEVIITLPSSV